MPALATYWPLGYYGPNATLPASPSALTTVGYTHTTLGELRTLLFNRLAGDTVFWTEDELNRYIIDALRHWSLLAQYYKDKQVFYTDPTEAFYSLVEQIPDLRGYTVTEQELIEIIQYHLMEPVDGTQWTGSEQFSYAQILESINRVRDFMLVETGLSLRSDVVGVLSPPTAKVALEDDIIDVRRVVWQDAGGEVRTLVKSDMLGRNFFNPRASFNPGMPEGYMTVGVPLVSLELTPPSNNTGNLQLITSRTGEVVDGSGILLGVPDDFTPTLKWGVLADLLNNERATDADRAAYCEARWQEGLESCKVSPSVWSMEVEGRQVSTASLEELDHFNSNWQNSEGRPTQVAALGYDLIALSPVPDDVYAVTATVTRRAIVPDSDDDYIQIGKEYINNLLDYCVHLATFKQGGETFLATKPQLEGFIGAAQGRNSKLRAQAFYLDSGTAQSNREQVRRPLASN